MVNVGLRAYVWNRKDRAQRVTRVLWSINGATYHAYRQYVNHVKERGFPDQSVETVVKEASTESQQSSLQTKPSLASQSSLAWKTSRAFTFAGARLLCIVGSLLCMLSYSSLAL